VNNLRDKSILKLFGIKLREIRKSKKMSQDDLALEADIEKSQIYRIENGLVNPTITTVIVIARALNIKPSELFKDFV
jgi:transcriptional regulator with XRE-family HTH domain